MRLSKKVLCTILSGFFLLSQIPVLTKTVSSGNCMSSIAKAAEDTYVIRSISGAIDFEAPDRKYNPQMFAMDVDDNVFYYLESVIDDVGYPDTRVTRYDLNTDTSRVVMSFNGAEDECEILFLTYNPFDGKTYAIVGRCRYGKYGTLCDSILLYDIESNLMVTELSTISLYDHTYASLETGYRFTLNSFQFVSENALSFCPLNQSFYGGSHYVYLADITTNSIQEGYIPPTYVNKYEQVVRIPFYHNDCFYWLRDEANWVDESGRCAEIYYTLRHHSENYNSGNTGSLIKKYTNVQASTIFQNEVYLMDYDYNVFKVNLDAEITETEAELSVSEKELEIVLSGSAIKQTAYNNLNSVHNFTITKDGRYIVFDQHDKMYKIIENESGNSPAETQPPTTTPTTPTPDVSFEDAVSCEYNITFKSGYFFSHDYRPFDPTELVATAYRRNVYEDGAVGDWYSVPVANLNIRFVSDVGTNAPQTTYDMKIWGDGGFKLSYVITDLKAIITDVLPSGTVIETSLSGQNGARAYIGVKGDANLDGYVSAADGAVIRYYYESKSSGLNPTLSSDTSLEKFVYFLADVNGESSDGGRTDSYGNPISPLDADDVDYIVSYSQIVGAQGYCDWADLLSPMPRITAAIANFESGNTNTGTTAPKLELLETEIVLENGSQYTIHANQSNLTYSSNRTDVAVVSANGVVTALKEGNAVISVINDSFDVVQLKVTVVPAGIQLGDVNCDGDFNILDVVALQKWLLGVGRLSYWQNADFNMDGQIDVFDLCLMKRELLKQL